MSGSILIVGSHLNYNLEHYTKIAFENLGYRVVFFGYRDVIGRGASVVRMAISRSNVLRQLLKSIPLGKMNDKLIDAVSDFQPSLLLSIKGEAILPHTVRISEQLGVKTALWYPDDPRFFGLVKEIAPCYDHVFTASEKAVKLYESIGVDAKYLPFACEPSVHRKVELTDEERKRLESDICFIGVYYPERGKIIRKLRRFNISVYGPYWQYFWRGTKPPVYGEEMVKAFNASRIVLNVHIKDDLPYKTNMRTFEATGCGAFLLTDKPYGLEQLFTPRKELVCYQNEKELVELLQYYLDHEDERVAIGINGQEKAYRNHTYEHRAKEILATTGVA